MAICATRMLSTGRLAKGTLVTTVMSNIGLEKAVRVILKAQVKGNGHHQGGWRYRVDSNDADLSVTSWQVMALRGARNIGCDVPASTMKEALAYLERCRDPASGGFVAAPSLDHAATAAVLRAGYLSTADASTPGALAIDLSSERVRQAQVLLEGVRTGQSLGALLAALLQVH